MSGPMDDPWGATGLFRSEIVTQCHFVEMAARDLDALLTKRKAGDYRSVWRELQTILVSAANISKMLWGSRGRFEAERKPLRDQLGVADDSTLRNPALRNDFEHFDERITRWARANPSGEHRTLLVRNIGPKGRMFMINGKGDEEIGHFGFFDPQTGIVEFWQNEVDLRAVTAEARRIRAAIEALEPWRVH